ncbi:MAG: T9SS type A sorting domain-containing protein [Candidatus Krumholzibacteriales bacterium]
MKKITTGAALFILVILSYSPLFSQQCHPYTISWDPVTDPDVDEVCIYRSRNDFGNPVLIGTVSPGVTEYTDNSTLQTGILYCYGLKAGNSSGSYSAFSQAVAGLTIDESSSSSIQQLCRIDSISVIDDSSCTVYWSTSNPTTGFVICRESQGSVVDTTQLSVTASEVHSAILTGLQPNRSYVVKAVSYSQDETMIILSAEFPFITEIEGDINFVISATEIEVDEGGTGQLLLSLDSEPPIDIEVSVRRISGDSTLTVSSGSNIVFGSENWNSGEMIEIAAAEDIDTDDEMGTFVVEAQDGAGVPIRFFTARSLDNDESQQHDVMQSPAVCLYPQPFNPDEGQLHLTNLPERGELHIYNLTGHRVWNTSWSGTSNTEWDGLNSSNTGVSSGRYFVVIRDLANNNIEKKAILVVR